MAPAGHSLSDPILRAESSVLHVVASQTPGGVQHPRANNESINDVVGQTRQALDTLHDQGIHPVQVAADALTSATNGSGDVHTGRLEAGSVETNRVLAGEGGKSPTQAGSQGGAATGSPSAGVGSAGPAVASTAFSSAPARSSTEGGGDETMANTVASALPSDANAVLLDLAFPSDRNPFAPADSEPGSDGGSEVPRPLPGEEPVLGDALAEFTLAPGEQSPCDILDVLFQAASGAGGGALAADGLV